MSRGGVRNFNKLLTIYEFLFDAGHLCVWAENQSASTKRKGQIKWERSVFVTYLAASLT